MDQAEHLNLPDLIRIRREARGWSQKELAAEVSRKEGSRTPLSHSTIQQWERGDTAPKRKRMMAVAELLEIPLSSMIGASAEGVSGSNAERTVAPSLEECIRILANALLRTRPESREVASVILAGLAQNPENETFLRVLLDLLRECK